jgi:LysW-gamma-L-lysine carboxypeptidase
MKSNDLVGKIRDFTTQYAAARDDVKVEVAFEDLTEPFLNPTNSSELSAFRWAIRKVRGGQVALLKKTGTSDVNLFAQTHNAPMFAYGPGESRFDHTEVEHVRVSEYLASIEVYAYALQRLAERVQGSELQQPVMK